MLKHLLVGVDRLKGFDEFEADGVFIVWEVCVQLQLEIIRKLRYIVCECLGMELINDIRSTVRCNLLQDEMTNQVHKDENACTSTIPNVQAPLLGIESPAHRSRDLVHILFLVEILVDLLGQAVVLDITLDGQALLVVIVSADSIFDYLYLLLGVNALREVDDGAVDIRSHDE